MIKLKTFFTPIFSRVYQNSGKFYSKSAKELNLINLSDDKSTKGKKCGQPNPITPKNSKPPRGGYIQDECGYYDIPKTNSRKWRRISLAVLPIVFGLSAFLLGGSKEQLTRQFIPYDYLQIYNKRFPWGDGKKSLFHGPNNVIPSEQKKGENVNGEEAKEEENQEAK